MQYTQRRMENNQYSPVSLKLKHIILQPSADVLYKLYQQ